MQKYIITDLDGTLALTNNRNHFLEKEPKDWDGFYEACDTDTINLPALLVIESLSINYGYDVIIVTGRSDLVYLKTRKWLKHYRVPFSHIFMRKHGDHTEDIILKEKWLNEGILPPKEDIFLVLEDRKRVVDMWRKHGLVCFQVAEGNF